MYSFHIDSVLCLAAHYSGFQQIFLPPPCATFHIEHGIGSGWTPAGEAKLFERMRKAGIPCLEYEFLLHWSAIARRDGHVEPVNSEDWGFAGLPSRSVAPSEGDTIEGDTAGGDTAKAPGVEQLTLEGARLRTSTTACLRHRTQDTLRLEFLMPRVLAFDEERKKLQEKINEIYQELHKVMGLWEYRGNYIEELLVEIKRLQRKPRSRRFKRLFWWGEAK